MLAFRVLNEFDCLVNPIKNGIVSKKMIYDAVESYLIANDSKMNNNLSSVERDLFIKDYMKKYILDHNHKLNRIFERKHLPVKNSIYSFLNDKDIYSYYKMLFDLSSLPSHLVNGSKSYTNWISTTSDFDKIWKYYDNQNIHKVAVLDLYTNGVYNEDTYIVDLSSKKIIDEIRFISNKIDKDNYGLFVEYLKLHPELECVSKRVFNDMLLKPTSKKFSGYNFAASDCELCIYEYLSANNIISLIGSLEIDLICAGIFNEKFFKLSVNDQNIEIEKLKSKMLKHILRENDSYMLYIFEELYLNDKNLNNLDGFEKAKLMRDKIIVKSRNLNSIMIKK